MRENSIEQSSGYSAVSIVAHWLAAIAIIALFFTHEGIGRNNSDSAAAYFHVSIGAVIGLFLIWRSIHRMVKGPAAKPDQHWLLNLLSDGVRWGILVATVVVVVTGYLLPWTLGNPIDFAGLFELPSPLTRSRGLHEASEQIHDIAGHLFMPLIVLHIAGAIKHRVASKDGVWNRMFKVQAGGK